MRDLLIERKFSILNIFQIIVPLAITTCIIYSVHLINIHIALLEKKLIELNQNLTTLQKKNLELQAIVNDKVLEIQQLKASLQDQMLLVSKAKNVSAEVILAHNDMTQFYIKTAGSICVVALVFGSLYYLSGFSFSAKALLPAGLYEFIQDNSYFFQTSRVYNFYETNSHTDWLIKVINEKHVNLTVKPEFSSDFIGVGDFILSLHSNAGTLARRLASTIKDNLI